MALPPPRRTIVQNEITQTLLKLTDAQLEELAKQFYALAHMPKGPKYHGTVTGLAYFLAQG